MYKEGGKAAVATKLMALMGLGIKGGTVTVTVEGSDEDIAVVSMETFFRNNL